MGQSKIIEFNLERYFPTVEQGILLTNQEILRCRKQKIRVIKLIHGYGSSGVGGRLRHGIRRHLQSMIQTGSLRGLAWGEEFSIFDETTRQMLEAVPELRKDSDLERCNQGITMVFIG